MSSQKCPAPDPSTWVSVGAVETVDSVWVRWRHVWQPFDDILDPRLPEDFEWPEEVPVDAFACPPEFRRLIRVLMDGYPFLFQRPAEEPHRSDPAVFDRLMALTRSHAPEGLDFRTRWRVLEVIDAGNRFGRWLVPTKLIPAPLPPPSRPVFSAESFERMVDHEGFYQGFISSVVDRAPPDVAEMSEGVFWGQILTSLCLLSGVVQSKWLWAVPDAVHAAPKHFEWLDLVLHQGHAEPENQGVERMQRVFLDPISRWLLVRAQSNEIPPVPRLRRTTRNLFVMIAGYARYGGFGDACPRNWSVLKDVATTRLALFVPPHLVGYAKGFYASASLPASVLERLFKMPGRIPMDPVERRPSVASGGAEVVDYDGGVDSDRLLPNGPPKILGELGGAIKNSQPRNPGRLETWLEEREGQAERESGGHTPPSVYLLGYWALRWLFRGHQGRRALKPKTAYGYYNAIAARLYGQMGYEDFSQVETPGDFIELYSNALDDAETGAQRKRIANALRSFHEFLTHTYPTVPSLEGAGVFEAGHHQPQAVDANFLDPEAFDWVVRWLEREHGAGTDACEIRVLVACLAYYCGYRRSEAVGLRVGDIDPPPWFDLVVKPNSTRTLKSGNAHRMSPVRVLIPKRYLDRLTDWVERRRVEIARTGKSAQEEALFEASDLNDEAYATARSNPLATVLDDITDAMVRITGDPTIRFHHLRHAFANRLFLTLWRGENDDQDDGTGWFDHLLGFEDPVAVRQMLVGQARVQRRSLRLLSMLLGHATTDITLNHYVHFTDFLLGRAVRKATPELTPRQIANLCDVSERALATTMRTVGSSDTAMIVDHLTDKVLGSQKRLRFPEAPKRRTLQRPRDPFRRRLLFADAVNDLAEGKNLEGLFEYPWSLDRLKDAVERVQRFPSHWRFSRRGLGAPALEPPRTQQDRRLARQTLKYLDNLKPEQRRAFVGAYLRGCGVDHAVDVVFAKVTHAKRWAALLEHLGLCASVDLIHRANVRSQSISQLQQFAYWDNRFGGPCALSQGAPGPGGTLLNNWGERGRLECRRSSPILQARVRWQYGIRWAFTVSGLELKIESET